MSRGPLTADARRTALLLTPAGRALRERAAAFRTTWLTGILDGWDAGDVRGFAILLDRFAAIVVERGGPGSVAENLAR